MTTRTINFTLNGDKVAAEVKPHHNLVELLQRDFNLMVGAYYASKLLLLTACSWSQVCLLFVVVRAWCGPPGPGRSVPKAESNGRGDRVLPAGPGSHQTGSASKVIERRLV